MRYHSYFHSKMVTIAKPNGLALLPPGVESLYSISKEMLMGSTCSVIRQEEDNEIPGNVGGLQQNSEMLMGKALFLSSKP